MQTIGREGVLVAVLVVAPLVATVVGVVELVHEGAEASVGSEDVETGKQCAEQGHDPRAAKTNGWSLSPVHCQSWGCNPLKGWVRDDTAPRQTGAVPPPAAVHQRTLRCYEFGHWVGSSNEVAAVG